MATEGKTLTVEQIGSPIRRDAKQRQTLIGLKLNKLNRSSTLPDTPAVRGGGALLRGGGRRSTGQ